MLVPAHWVDAARWVWTISAFLFFMGALFNLKEAFIDYWPTRDTRYLDPDKMPAAEALRQETLGSLRIQLCVSGALAFCFFAGVVSIVSLPFVVIAMLIVMEMFLGGLTVLETIRRIKVVRALRRARSNRP